MKCPCNGCDERVLGCHSKCTKEPSYDDWKKWSDEMSEKNRVINKERSDYLQSLLYSTRIKRRKR